ncbi:AzlD family protein [Oecophyllibacter saccharovorans]|uniref:AzlD family protein n=1 Tax=Oecophyllibacter saccharovorans TaxID=2558360 RepID=A0A506ULQ3_9PROT|nr:AzlD family protein [Oecophyllibacter saccharovorans]QDH15425.1 AzlD family protein [Oecophyllibacter saccharovorans]TPW34258.1 AzlD family protein [Oecophyllibacter saccharovorans]TPW36445.1 AzlD family protein [Oecophyllibacter saccharovorans]
MTQYFHLQALNVLTILLMAGTTYCTRIGGYLLLRHHTPGPRLAAVMRCAPGCVLVSIIAPAFTSPHPATLLALACTVLAAWRLPMLATVLIGIGSAFLFRQLLG